jgi:amino acid adenylation domain-containing protein/non-ribosomal peptide synthase protein (TIGR01720 family)
VPSPRRSTMARQGPTCCANSRRGPRSTSSAPAPRTRLLRHQTPSGRCFVIETRLPSGDELDQLKARARAGDRGALQRLRESGFFEKKSAERRGYAAAHAQKRLWALDRMLDGRSPAYNVPVALVLEGELDREALTRALAAILARHESLRTAIREIDGEPRQFIEAAPAFDVPVVDLRGEQDPDAAARDAAAREAERPFDLTHAPMFRAALLRTADARHLLLLTAHHIVFDEWSSSVFVRDLAAAYRAGRDRTATALPPLPIQYKDFTDWQNTRLASTDAERHRAYWIAKLSGVEPVLLPTDRARPTVQTYPGATVVRQLDANAWAGLEQLARREGASMFMAIATVAKTLLHRYTGQTDITIGTTTAGRERRELTDQIGFYVNALALRDTVEPATTFRELLGRVRTTATDAYEHQEYPFDRLVDEVTRERDLSRSPLFDVMLVVNDDPTPPLNLEGLRVSPLEQTYSPAKYDLTLDFVRTDVGWTLRVIYNTELFSDARVRRMLAHLDRLTAAAVAQPDAAVGELDLMGDHERATVAAWSVGETQAFLDEPLSRLFEAQVARTPECEALRVPTADGARRSWTYRELDVRAGRIAAALGLHVSREAPVAVLSPRGDRLITALLGVLKSGATYVPLDPSLPIERLSFMVNDAGAMVVLADDTCAALAARLGVPVVLDIERAAASDLPSVPAELSSRDRAYVIYTSGSTGVPKGVEVEHRGFANMIATQIAGFHVEPDDVVLQFASCTFDASLSEIFMALLRGACLVCPPEALLKDPTSLQQLLVRERITIATLPPPYIRALGFDPLRTLKTLVTAGEDAAPDRGQLARAGVCYVNAYGPTEFSVCATFGEVTGDEDRVPIGRPIANSEVAILERGSRTPAPIGVPGEICLAGPGLARGYLLRPELTAQAFSAHPERAGERMYRTGDLGRWREDGGIEFLGRIDHQVKVRGYRVEPGEVEAALRRQAGVADAVVIYRDGGLTGYVESTSALDTHEMRAQLSESLPEYMVPSAVVVLERFPRLASGKVDRAALPKPHAASAIPTAPRNAVEHSVADIWRDVLGLDSIGVHDRFLDVGGNSMKAILLVSRVLKEFGTRLPIREVFERGTIAALAPLVGGAPGDDVIPVIARAARYPTSHAQRRLWTIERMGEAAGAYHIAGAIRLRSVVDGAIDAAALRTALESLALRHESLRTTFVEVDGAPWQQVHDMLPLDFEHVDFLGVRDADDAVREWIEADVTRPFDLGAGPLFRVRLFTTGAAEAVLYVNIHHIVSDGWSMEVFFRDLVDAWRGQAPRAALPIHYKDFAAWQNARIAGESGRADRDYWTAALRDAPLLELPADRSRPAVQTFAGDTVTVTFDADVTQAFDRLARDQQITPVALWLSLLSAIVQRYTGTNDLIVGLPSASREHPALEDQIGLFLNMVPLRISMAAGDSFAERAAHVRSVLHDSFAHKDYPYDLIVEELGLHRDMSRNPLFDVGLSVQEGERRGGGLSGVDARPFAFAGRTSKFDLTLFASQSGERWELVLEYDTALFDRWRIETLARHLQQLLRSASANVHGRIRDLDLMDEAERADVCDVWNRTATTYPRDEGLTRLFADIVSTAGERVAIRSAERTLTYRELDAVSDRIAAALHAAGPVPAIVPVVLPRSWSAIAAILGIVKAGAAYAPFEASLPAERIRRLVHNLGASMVVTDRVRLESTLADIDGVRGMDVAALVEHDARRAPADRDGGSLAYVMYTSGSTGVPKGVLVEDRAITRLVRNTNYVAISPADCFLHTSSLAFDASTFEIWGALLNGATLAMPPADEAPGGMEVRSWLEHDRPTVLFVTTSLFNQLAEFDAAMFRDVRVLITGGERVSPAHLTLVRQACPDTALVHAYGPTENTTFSLCYPIPAIGADDVPLGPPIANSRAYIVDDDLRPQPVGVPGEILVAGDGVARGYLNDAALTRERFVADPFVAGARAYRSGDRGFWRHDGTIAFLGRTDDQVKVRGFRIEPAEIAAALRTAGATSAAVVARRTSVGTQELVAYFVASDAFDARALREALRSTLPTYMIPAEFVRMDRLPLTPNGKLDRRALPDPVREAAAAEVPAGGLNEREAALGVAWAEVLGRGAPAPDDNYFDIGGDSIQAIQIASRLRRAGWLMKVRDLFLQPTIRALAPLLTAVDAVAHTPPVAEGDEASPSPIQKWFLQQEGPLDHFNQSVWLRATERLDARALELAVSALVERHAALRTAFVGRADASMVTRIMRPTAPPLEVVDVSGASGDVAAAVTARTTAIQSSFDRTTGRLFHAALFRGDESDHLFLCAHHLAVDGVSWRILLDDLEIAYGQARSHVAIDLGAEPASYGEWARRLARRAQDHAFGDERDYWKRIDRARSVPLPYDIADAGPGTFGEAASVTIRLNADETSQLVERTFRAYGARVDELLATAVARAVSALTSHPRVILTVEAHGRDSEWLGLDVGRTVGWFTTLYPLVIDLPGTSIGVDVKTVKETMRRVPRHGVGYGARAAGTVDAARPPVSFNYLGRFEGSTQGRAFAAADEPAVGPNIASAMPRSHHLDVSGAIAGGALEMTIAYSPARFARATIERLAASMRDEVIRIADHCAALERPEKTPSDFADCAWSLDEYAVFLRDSGLAASSIDDVAHLSPMQEGLLYQRRLDPESTAYHVQLEFALRGALDVDRYARAWTELARRHPMLRTAFFDEGLTRPMQVVLKDAPFEFAYHDVTANADGPALVHQYRDADLKRPFDMRRAPLWRLAVFAVGRNRYRVVWSCHHILIDGWSLAIVYRQLSEIYAALERGEESVPVPERRFTDFVRWLEGTDAGQARAHWSAHLAGFEARTSPPRAPIGRRDAAYAFGERTFDADAALSASIHRAAAQLGVTAYTIVQAAWSLLLARDNDRHDVVFGAIVSGRPPALDHIEDTVGLFINALPVRVRVTPGATFADLAREIQRLAVDQVDYHTIPLADIQQLTPLGRDLFDHLLVYENYPTAVQAIDGGGDALVVEAFEAYDESHYPLNVVVVPGSPLQFRVSSNTNVYPLDWVERHIGHLFALLDGACADVDRPIDELDPVPQEERRMLTGTFQGRRRSIERLPSVVEMLRDVARAQPDAAAVRCGSSTLTCSDLDDQSDRFAAWLVDRRGVAPGDRVAVLTNRSERLIVALVAILKAGAAYVPIDPLYPRERVAFMLEDSGAVTLLTDDIDAVWSEAMATPRRTLPTPEADSLAYIIYTSGSTGRPKGCAIEHRNLAHYLEWAARAYFGDGDGGSFALYSSLSFDLTVTSLFLPLVRGRVLHVLPQPIDVHDALAEMLDPASGVDAIKLTPSHITLIPELGLRTTNVALAIVGGEALRADHVRALRALNPQMAIFNEYGPTETTVGCIVKRIEDPGEAITIGVPIDDTRIHIVDRERRLVPIGVAGEILIAGAGVGRGYHGRADLTAERFIDESAVVGTAEPGRAYVTGDLGRWLPNGEVEYLGRADDQVKVRGHRIELAEVEAAIARADATVTEVAVIARQDAGAGTYLAAYVAGCTDFAALRETLAISLPEALVPTAFVAIDRLPLTVNGKVDRAALPDPLATAAPPEPRAWQTTTEAQVAAIWQQVLGVERIGRDDRFFALGGHSLKATQIVSRILRQLGVKVSLREFFEAATVAAVAAIVEQRGVTRGEESIPPAPARADYALAPAQHRLWLLHQFAGGESAHNLLFAVEVEGDRVDAAALQQALGDLASRHETLRTAFVTVDGEPRQRIVPAPLAIPIRLVDFSAADGLEGDARAREAVASEMHRPFDLTAPPLARALLIALPDGDRGPRSVLVLTLHHIVADGLSVVVLTRELAAAYAARRRSTTATLPPLRIQYKDYAQWQLRHDWSATRDWWRQAMAKAPDALTLPYDMSPSGERDFAGAAVHAGIDATVADALRQFADRSGATLAHVVLALFQLALYKLSGQSDVCVALSVDGRSRPELEHLVGCFVNLVPVRVLMHEDLEFDALVAAVSRAAGEALDHECPFDLLVRELRPQRVGNRQPLVNVVFTFQRVDDLVLDGFAVDSDAGSALSIRPYPVELRTSKFDVTLLAADEGRGAPIQLTLEYDTHLFRETTAERMLGAVARFATAAVMSTGAAQL